MTARRNTVRLGDGVIHSALAAIEQHPTPRNAAAAYTNLLRRCGESRSLSEGRLVHDHLVSRGRWEHLAVPLVQMYGKCGSPDDATHVFEAATRRSSQLWGTIVSVLAKNGKRREAFELYARMEKDRVQVGASVLVSLFGACCSCDALEDGRSLHRATASKGIVGDMILDTSVVNMYSKCGSLDEARVVFDAMTKRDVVSYTAMIVGYAQKGDFGTAFRLYKEMDSKGVQPNNQTFASVLSVCPDLQVGRSIHNRIVESKVQKDVVLENALLNMYAKCGSLDESRKLFNGMARRNVGTWNAMVGALVSHELNQEAVDLYKSMDVEPNAITFVSILGACSCPEALEDGRAIHRRVLAGSRQLQFDDRIQNSLLSMYAKCASLPDARKVFDGIRDEDKTVFSWTAMITGYSQHGYAEEALELFNKMVEEDRVAPDAITYASALTACGNLGLLEQGRRIHEQFTSRGLQTNILDTALIQMYGKCGSLDEAVQAFNRAPVKDSIIWTVIIAAHVQEEQYEEAFQLFRRMDLEGLPPTNVTFARMVTACSSLGALDEGRLLHARTDAFAMQNDDVLQDGLLNMYVRCGSLVEADRVFHRMLNKNVFSWTTMISAYNQYGFPAEALRFYQAMDMEPDDVTFLSAITACSSLGDVEQGRAIHSRVVSRGFLPSSAVRTGLVTMYARCGCLEEATRVFEDIDVSRDRVCWTAMISAFLQHGYARESLMLFRRMEQDGVFPNAVTFCSIIGACSSVGSLKDGQVVQEQVWASGYANDISVQNALLNMFSRCGRIDLARQQFQHIAAKNSVSWSIMMGACVQHGYAAEAMQLYHQMDAEGLELDAVAFTTVLAACIVLEDLQQGRNVYKRVRFMNLNSTMLQNTAINMYSRCGSVDEARDIFDGMQQQDRNVVTWTTMVSAYLQHARPGEALELYQQMDVEPNRLCLVSALSACSTLGELEHGREVHRRAAAVGLDNDQVVMTALVNMYAKCGRLSVARELFDQKLSSSDDVVAWNAMSSSYSQFGHKKDVLSILRQMCLLGVRPDGITFINVLVSCSQAGELSECKHHFGSLVADHGIRPRDEHYSCMVDLLGRLGRLDEAENVVANVKLDEAVDAAAWMSFLGACKTHNDKERGELAVGRLQRLDPGDTAPYILLSHIYVDE